MCRANKEEIYIPYGVGICGHVAKTKETINLKDAYEVVICNHNSILSYYPDFIITSYENVYMLLSIELWLIQDERFNKEVDAQTGYRTHSLVCMPVCNYDGEVIGVAQIINKRGGGNNHEFTETDLKVLKFIFYVLIFLASKYFIPPYFIS